MMRVLGTRKDILGALGAAGLVATLGCGQATASAQGEAGLSSEAAEQGYSLGFALGRDVSEAVGDVDRAALARGFADAAEQRESALDVDAMQAALAGYEMRQAEAARAQLEELAAANAAAGDAFREKFAQEPGVTELESGLLYRVLEPGSGDPPEKGSVVTLHYRGSLVDGTEFDESYSRGEPVTVPIDRVLPGWSAALERMPEGAKWQVVIPPSLAYGESGAAGFIEPNTTLIFELERVAT